MSNINNIINITNNEEYEKQNEEYEQWLQNEIEKEKKQTKPEIQEQNISTLKTQILEEKQKILQYLTNVNVNTYTPALHQIPKRIYDVNANRITIWNLDTITPQYLHFLQFMNKEFKKIYGEFNNNNGEIITSHVSDNLSEVEKTEANKILQNYKKQYEDIFTNSLDNDGRKHKLNSLDNDGRKHKLNSLGKAYPNFSGDMMSKTRKTQYEIIEKTLGIKTQIQDQTSLEFLETIVKRIKGLFKCYNAQTINYELENENYYYTELIREIENLRILLGISAEYKLDIKYSINTSIKIEQCIKFIEDSINIIIDSHNVKKADKIVKKHCKNILWGPNDYKYNEDIKDEDKKEKLFKEFKKFIEANPIELLFLKTFMIDCFYKNENGEYTNNINWDLVKSKMDDRKYRQIFFSYNEIIKKYEKYKSFYEVLGSNSIIIKGIENRSCNNLVVWSIFLDFYFNRCSKTNTDIDIPIRFKLPGKDNYRKQKDNNSKLDHYSNYKYDFRSPSHNNDIFDGTDISFIGFINIKFYYETKNQFRNWTLFVFNNKSKKQYMNYMSGELVNFPILSHELEFIHSGSIVARDPVTYEEIKFFKNQSDNNILFIYISKLDNETLFITYKDISNLEYLKDLMLERITIKSSGEDETTDRKNRYIKIIPYSYSNENKKQGGGNNKLTLELKFTNNINIYTDELNNTNIYSKYFKITKNIYKIGNDSIYKFNKILYKFFLIAPNTIVYSYLNTNISRINILPKYNPISTLFFHYNEIYTNFNVINKINNNITILCIGSITPIEVIKFNNYKIKNIKYLNYYKNNNYQLNFLNTIKNIYDIDIIDKTNENIYLLPNLYPELYSTFNLNMYSINIVNNEFYMADIFYNVINIYIGALVGLKYTSLNGTFILNLNSISNKPIADIYLILKQYFKESHLYYAEISNMVKLSGTYGIFQGFKGIKKDELENLENIFEKLKKQYPNNMIEKFNIYDSEIRKDFNITKPIEQIGNRFKYIDGFLNIKRKSKEFEDIYKEIIEFNNLNYINRLIYVKKLLYNYENNIIVKTPTQDQILSSILYCRKYNIPIFDKYTITKQDNTITKTILSDLYGLHEPILAAFKKAAFRKSRAKNRSAKYRSVKHNSVTISKTSKTRKSSNSFFNDLFSMKQSKNQSSSKHKSSTTRKTKLRYHANVSLEEAVFNSNNQLVQVGRLIDSRKDFTKANPTEVYDKLKDQLRFYKGTGKMGKDNRHIENLDVKVQKLLGDFSISQAWLKMYEIITECKLIPNNRKGVYRSFHICEAPGTFINCINNYIHTKTQYDSYEWKANSLKPSGKIIGDTYGLIKRHPNNWDWGVDGTGDITNTSNIRHYAKIAKSMNANLMTSDCGLPWGDPKYYHVAFASYVSILCSLPNNGTMVYKILSPIDIPLIWNLIYITYTNFKEMYFFKPVQNSQSREFYIIGKGYQGTDQKVLDKLLNLVDKFGRKDFNKEEYDMYSDMYPEEFVIQVQTISERLASNYVNSIERIIYYVDNIDLLGKYYQKHIEDYMKEKNEDWIKKYNPQILVKSAPKL